MILEELKSFNKNMYEKNLKYTIKMRPKIHILKDSESTINMKEDFHDNKTTIF